MRATSLSDSGNWHHALPAWRDSADVDQDTIERILREDVIKRETLEGPEADSAAKRVARNSERSIVKERETKEEAGAAKAADGPTPVVVATK
jgi:hypothetical protein